VTSDEWGAPRDRETRPATAVAWQRTDTAVLERGQRQRGGDPHPTAVGLWFAMRPQSQAWSHPRSQSWGAPVTSEATCHQPLVCSNVMHATASDYARSTRARESRRDACTTHTPASRRLGPFPAHGPGDHLLGPPGLGAPGLGPPGGKSLPGPEGHGARVILVLLHGHHGQWSNATRHHQRHQRGRSSDDHRDRGYSRAMEK